MARNIYQLSALSVRHASKTGNYSDGGGLYLQVSRWGGKSRMYRFYRNGKLTGMGLGSLQDVSLAEAREKAAECRKLHKGEPGSDCLDAPLLRCFSSRRRII